MLNCVKTSDWNSSSKVFLTLKFSESKGSNKNWMHKQTLSKNLRSFNFYSYWRDGKITQQLVVSEALAWIRDWQRINWFETVESFFLILFGIMNQESPFSRLWFESKNRESTFLTSCFESVNQESTFLSLRFESKNQESTFLSLWFESVNQESTFLSLWFESVNQKSLFEVLFLRFSTSSSKFMVPPDYHFAFRVWIYPF